MRKQVSEAEQHQEAEQVLSREESTPGKAILARRGATHDVKRRRSSERAG